MKYRQLTREERYLMSVELSTGASLRAVAIMLGRHASTRARWSVEQISGRLRRHGCLRIATSTIYRWVKNDKQRGGQLWETTRRLSRKRGLITPLPRDARLSTIA